MPEAWVGRVFASRHAGGNHTAIVGRGYDGNMLTCAAHLGLPDTAFVMSVEERAITLRTFSPFEELRDCLQTSLAAIIAMDAPPAAFWMVSHAHGGTVQVVRDADVPDRVWATLVVEGPEPAEAAALPALPRAEMRHVAGPRPRLLAEFATEAALEELKLAPNQVMQLCREHAVNGIVAWSMSHPTHIRMRVFTTSLGGGEDRATGGAVANLGSVLHARGMRGVRCVSQGCGPASNQGSFALDLQSNKIRLGAEVTSLLRGALLV